MRNQPYLCFVLIFYLLTLQLSCDAFVIIPFWKQKGCLVQQRDQRNKPGRRQMAWQNKNKKNNIRDSNVVPHRSTNLTRRCLTALSGREAVLSSWYGRSYQ